MGRVVIVVAPGAGFGPGAVAAWNANAEASAAGTAGTEAARGEVFFPGLVKRRVVPLAANVASSVAYDLLKRLAGRLRQGSEGDPEVKLPAVSAGGGDVVIVIRGGDGLR